MAVVDKVAPGTLTATQLATIQRNLYTKGANAGVLLATASVAAADDDGSIYRLFSGLSATLVPLMIFIGNTAITAGTDYDLGIYTAGTGGAVKIAEVFRDTMDLSTAHASMNPVTSLDGMADVLAANLGRAMYAHAGDTLANMADTYDICLTANTVGSAAGTVTGLLLYAVNV